MRNILLAFTSLALCWSASAAELSLAPRADFDSLAARATVRLPPGWRVAERTFGPQQITMHWGARPIGLRVRLDGPQWWSPAAYSAPPMTPAERLAYFRDRPESIYLWVVPHSYKPRKDSFVIDWFRPADEVTYRLGSTATLDLYAYGGFGRSWAQWRSDLRRNLRR